MIRHKSQKTKKLVYEFDEKKLRGEYYAAPATAFEAFSRVTRFNGFPRLPKGFSTDGFGFASPASSFLGQALRDGFGNGVRLTISKNDPSAARKTAGGNWHLTVAAR